MALESDDDKKFCKIKFGDSDLGTTANLKENKTAETHTSTRLQRCLLIYGFQLTRKY